MFSQSKLFVALALVATLVRCHAKPLEAPQNNDVVADIRPVLEAEVNGHLFKVPVYEDKVFTNAKLELDRTQYRDIKDKVLVVTKSVIVERKGYFSVAKKAWGFVGLFKDFMKAGRELSKTDTSPPVKRTFGPEMSQLVEIVLNAKTEVTNLSDRETYQRVDDVMNGIDQMIQQSPVGLYLDWNHLTIDGEPLPQYIAPVIHWMRHNGYSMLLKIVGMIGGLFKNIGKRD